MIEGFCGGVLNEKELDACFRVTRVYSKRFENPKISWLFIVPSPADYRMYILVPNPAIDGEVVREFFARKLKKRGGKKKCFG